MPGLDPGLNSRHQFLVPYWVYILANFKRGTLSVGVTNDFVRHVCQHREGETRGFTSRYAGDPPGPLRAIRGSPHGDPARQELKHWSRDWKIALIEKGNPYWRDLYDEITA